MPPGPKAPQALTERRLARLRPPGLKPVVPRPSSGDADNRPRQPMQLPPPTRAGMNGPACERAAQTAKSAHSTASYARAVTASVSSVQEPRGESEEDELCRGMWDASGTA